MSFSGPIAHPKILLLAIFLGNLALGCASPGPPLPPSLHLPKPVNDLTAKRLGGTVELLFTAPTRSTDNLPLQPRTLHAVLCRGLERQPCSPLNIDLKELNPTQGTHAQTSWHDTLPLDLTQGAPRLLTYRIEFLNPEGKSAGKSNPAYTITGTAPPPVEGLHAEGSRLGIVLRWTPATTQSGEILLTRETLPPAGQSTEFLQANATGTTTLDASARPDVPYRYSAVRRTVVQFGGRSIELRSVSSPSVTLTLHKIYPPPTPTGLNILGYIEQNKQENAPKKPSYAVDLIWQPVDDAGLISPLAGYNIYRIPTGINKETSEKPDRLNTAPIPLPSFHDTTADPLLRYQYSVTAVDANGNESTAISGPLEPTPVP